MDSHSRRRALHGVLLLDKPSGITSQTAVSRAKALLGAAKAGHTGTLDPLATGLLPLTFGEATKFSQSLLGADKRYVAHVRLGITTATGDLEGEILERCGTPPDLGRLEEVLAGFRGAIEQVPPMYSALKREGKPLYEYARAGIAVPREPRTVTVRSLELVGATGDELVLDIRCSKGTYVRVLAEDIGKALGCGACLAALRRTEVGPFGIQDAVTLDELGGLPEHERAGRLRPVDALVCDLPRVVLTSDEARRIEHGQPVEWAGSAPAGLVRIYGPAADFLGVAEAAVTGRLEPRRLVAARSAPVEKNAFTRVE
ncbi:MAG: tRNA pseudouridine(55) synthase TruB [Burkholderiales bacterium]